MSRSKALRLEGDVMTGAPVCGKHRADRASAAAPECLQLSTLLEGCYAISKKSEAVSVGLPLSTAKTCVPPAVAPLAS